MTLRLVIEHATHPQHRAEYRHTSGETVIGRGADCDWQLDDPDMFVSRKHCIVSGADGSYAVTDSSRGGLFIDGRDDALGAGRTAALEHGMRLRLGDVVIRIEIETPDAAPAPRRRERPTPTLTDDDFFSGQTQERPQAPRPSGLPEPFETGRPSAAEARPAPPAPRADFDDPVTLDPIIRAGAGQPSRPEGSAQAAPTAAGDFDFGAFFDTPPRSPEDAAPRAADTANGGFGADTTPPPEPQHPAPTAAQPQPDPDADGGFAAFLRGAGLDPEAFDKAGPDALEDAGARFRLLVEGLVHLLRTRAQEKNTARVAQTVIGAADVNPLKFLASTDDALAALIAPRGKGYLGPDEAISAAFRDLADHQLRTWTAVQSALRAMVDRFDPAAFEREAEGQGRLQSLLSGGRNGRLWQLYTERYREIARAAEERFLGEVGADFRDAYEGNRRKKDD